MHSYKDVFAALKEILARVGTSEREARLAALKIPTISINVFYKKKVDRPFMGTVETSTSVGAIREGITQSYEEPHAIDADVKNSGAVIHRPNSISDDEILQFAFNGKYYTRLNPASTDYHPSAMHHYLEIGWKNGADPTPGFSTKGYLEANPDVAASGIDPFLHFLKYGIAEGRVGHQKDR